MAGPVPKARAARLGHSGGVLDSAHNTVEIDAGAGADSPIPPVNPDWHPYARGWYNSLALSGQSKEYVPSDWMMAIIGAEMLDALLQPGGMRASLMAEFSEISTKLCCTLGDRRRARIELQKAGVKDDDDEAAAVSLDDWRNKMKEKSG